MKALVSLAMPIVMALPAQAQQTLTIASWAPPQHVVNAEVWPAFIERLEEISEGQLTAQVRLGLVPPPAMPDLVLDGGADITFIFHGYNAGRFVTAELVELPGTLGDAEATSVAYWHIWNDHLRELGEQDEYKTLAMFMHGAAQFHLTSEVDGLGAIDGMRLRAPGGVGSMVIERLGAVGIQVPATRVYETLSSGAADGVVMNVDSRIGFRLDEVAPVLFEVPGGLYRGSFAVLMNRETWDRLDPELQARLDAELFGEPLSRLFGAAWAQGDARARAAAVEAGTPVISLDAADVETFEAVRREVEAEILQRVSARGVDAQAVLAAFRELSAEAETR
ncbi:MAG: TRAP transporter substrate-binding protein [Rhodobacteraceae bacterium]|nr:TRAP transporter substrate-binding protein [Paracoccaceae bacterium]